MVAWVFTGILLVYIMPLKPSYIQLVLGAGIRCQGELLGNMNTSMLSLWKVANISYPSAKTYFITGLSPFVITGYEKGIMFICQEKQILSVCRLILAPPHLYLSTCKSGYR